MFNILGSQGKANSLAQECTPRVCISCKGMTDWNFEQSTELCYRVRGKLLRWWPYGCVPIHAWAWPSRRDVPGECHFPHWRSLKLTIMPTRDPQLIFWCAICKLTLASCCSCIEQETTNAHLSISVATVYLQLGTRIAALLLLTIPFTMWPSMVEYLGNWTW